MFFNEASHAISKLYKNEIWSREYQPKLHILKAKPEFWYRRTFGGVWRF